MFQKSQEKGNGERGKEVLRVNFTREGQLKRVNVLWKTATYRKVSSNKWCQIVRRKLSQQKPIRWLSVPEQYMIQLTNFGIENLRQLFEFQALSDHHFIYQWWYNLYNWLMNIQFRLRKDLIPETTRKIRVHLRDSKEHWPVWPDNRQPDWTWHLPVIRILFGHIVPN